MPSFVLLAPGSFANKSQGGKEASPLCRPLPQALSSSAARGRGASSSGCGGNAGQAKQTPGPEPSEQRGKPSSEAPGLGWGRRQGWMEAPWRARSQADLSGVQRGGFFPQPGAAPFAPTLRCSSGLFSKLFARLLVCREHGHRGGQGRGQSWQSLRDNGCDLGGHPGKAGCMSTLAIASTSATAKSLDGLCHAGIEHASGVSQEVRGAKGHPSRPSRKHHSSPFPSRTPTPSLTADPRAGSNRGPFLALGAHQVRAGLAVILPWPSPPVLSAPEDRCEPGRGRGPPWPCPGSVPWQIATPPGLLWPRVCPAGPWGLRAPQAQGKRHRSSPKARSLMTPWKRPAP